MRSVLRDAGKYGIFHSLEYVFELSITDLRKSGVVEVLSKIESQGEVSCDSRGETYGTILAVWRKN